MENLGKWVTVTISVDPTVYPIAVDEVWSDDLATHIKDAVEDIGGIEVSQITVEDL